MRITRETLLKIARDAANLRVSQDRQLITIYLIGSLLEDEPLVGGATDIDLVFVHSGEPAQKRELVRISDEVHLDIAHQPQSLYHQPRQLRIDPWLGPAIYANHVLLHDTQHWFEFAQASVRSQFKRADYALERAKPFAEKARQAWLNLRESSSPAPQPVQRLSSYLEAVENSANAIASLSGAPLTLRRFLLRFPERAQAIGRAELTASLFALLGAGNMDTNLVRSWLPDWARVFDEASLQPATSLRLHPYRKVYYQHAFEALLDGDQPSAVLWPLMRTWTLALCQLQPDPSLLAPWEEACRRLWPTEMENRGERLAGLDAFLDRVEETLDQWAQENGA